MFKNVLIVSSIVIVTYLKGNIFVEDETVPEICIEIVRLLLKTGRKFFIVFLQQSYGSFHHYVFSRKSQHYKEVSSDL
jgi:hypothetical protein